VYIYSRPLGDLGDRPSAGPMIVRPYESIRLGQASPSQIQYIEATVSRLEKDGRVRMSFVQNGAMDQKKRDQFIKRFVDPMSKHKVAQDLLAAILKGNHLVRIAWGNGKFGFNGTIAMDRKEALGGGGSDATIFIDQEARDLTPFQTIRENPDVGLFHELLHAWHIQRGTSIDDEEEMERRVIGIGKYTKAKGTENDYREARGLPRRCCWDREVLSK